VIRFLIWMKRTTATAATRSNLIPMPSLDPFSSGFLECTLLFIFLNIVEHNIGKRELFM
jgi:hypothetical protein